MSLEPDHSQFELTLKQKEIRSIFATGARYFLVYGGSRSGKTFFIVYAIIVRALKAPGSRHVIFRADGVDAKQAVGNETIPAVMSLAFPGVPFKWHEKDGYFDIGDGGAQVWLSGLKDKARLDKVLGKEYATIYLNEASQITLAAYTLVITRLAQVVKDINGKRLALRLYVDLNPTVSAHWSYQIWIARNHPDGNFEILDPENYRHITVNPVDNIDNLDEGYVKSLELLPERMRRRFFDGQFTADDDNALWQRKFIKVEDAPEMQRVVVAVDPAISNEVGSDETGLIVVGEGIDGRGYVLADESGKYRPEAWARRAISLFDTWDADRIVAEVNQGGDMVESTIKAQAKGRVIPYAKVHATKGKQVRATPVAALYEQNKVRHAEEFTELTDQMCAFTIDFDRKEQGYSPDRVDALVWGLTFLFPRLVQKVATAPSSIPKTHKPFAGRR